jgi:hypothetical protein
MATISFQAQLTLWEVLNTNLKPHLDTLPNLAKGQQDFEALITEGQTLNAQQSQLTGTLRDLIVRRKELERKGGVLREYLAAALRHELGPDNQKLREFNVKPRGRRKKAPAEPPVETPGPVTPQAAAT